MFRSCSTSCYCSYFYYCWVMFQVSQCLNKTFIVFEGGGRQLAQTGRPMVRMAQKLQRLKVALEVWNKNIFGHIGQSIKVAEDNILVAETTYDACPFEYNMQQLCVAKQVLSECLER